MGILYIIAVIADFVTILAFVLGVVCFRETISQKVFQFGFGNKSKITVIKEPKKK